MHSTFALLFLFIYTAAAFSLRSIPVSTKRLFLSAKPIATPAIAISDDVSEPKIAIKLNDYLSSLQSNVILGAGTPLCNVYLDLINDPERYLATIQRDINQGIHQKWNIWSLVSRCVGSVFRRLRLRSNNKTQPIQQKAAPESHLAVEHA
ncbi:hypothetical protein MHU86_982 [Fragilaria crotonensis]|nr:hypothetical protein MHU86_982 [Fragilaria crotonensis]